MFKYKSDVFALAALLVDLKLIIISVLKLLSLCKSFFVEL